MLLTVTPNPCVDRTYQLDRFEINRVNRPSVTYVMAGGKGINVARVYRTLGGDAFAVCFTGGINGQILRKALKIEGIPSQLIKVHGETRTCIAMIDSGTGTQTELNEPGPLVSDRACHELIRNVDRLMQEGTVHLISLSGSLPPDADSSLYAELIGVAKYHSVPVALDASGEALIEGVQASPWLVKVNKVEACQLLGSEIDSVQQCCDAAVEIWKTYAVKVAIITMGSEGAVEFNGTQLRHLVPPVIDFMSGVGSGDSFLAAYLYTWLKSDGRDALSVAVGAGAANAAVVGAGLCTSKQIYSCSEGVRELSCVVRNV